METEKMETEKMETQVAKRRGRPPRVSREMFEEMWNNAKKGPEGAQYLRSLVEIHGLD